MPCRRERRPSGGLGQSIRLIRKRLDLSQAKLARILKCDQKMISRYELGRSRVGAQRLIRLLKDLACGDEERAPIIATLEAQGVSLADLSAIASTVNAQSAQQSPEATQ